MEALTSLARPQFSFRAAAITKIFGETVALWQVDLHARSGELLAVHGANASGKTTLLRIIAGLTAPTRGGVTWATPPGRRPRVAMVGHATHLFDRLSPLENVALAARLARRDEAVAVGLLAALGVGRFGARPVQGLSAGTRRRVGLARAVATDPDVLVVDEPFAGLDPEAAELVGRLLASLRDEGRLLVVASHDDSRTRLLATRSAWIEGGRVNGRPAIGALAG